MIQLIATTDKLQLVTDSAADVDVVASFSDLSGSTVTPDKQLTAITTATTTDVLAAPASSTSRRLHFMSIRNKDTADSTTVTVVFDANGTDYELHKVTLAPGDMLEYAEGVGFYKLETLTTAELIRVLSADDTGANSNSAQPWFATNGSVAVQADTTYEIVGFLHITRAAGTTSHTTGIGFGGTATITSFSGMYQCGEGDVATLADSDIIVASSVANLQVKAASTSSTENIKIQVRGVVRINAAGTFIPQFTFSSAPGGAPTIEANSFFKMTPLGAGAFTSQGTWS